MSKSGYNRERVLELRQADPSLRAIRIAEELGISRERVRQILIHLDLETNMKDAPVKHKGHWYLGRRAYTPKPTATPRPVEISSSEALPLPDICPKCSGASFYKDVYLNGDWEVKCRACGMIIAFGSQHSS